MRDMMIRGAGQICAVWAAFALLDGCVPVDVEGVGAGPGSTQGTGGATSETGGAGGTGASSTVGMSGGAGGDGGSATTGSTGPALDSDWALDEVKQVVLPDAVAAGQLETQCVYCPTSHPVPMAGGFLLSNSGVFAQASYPQNWEQPDKWLSENEWERAGWCATVHNVGNNGMGGWEVHLTCRDTSSVDVTAVDTVLVDTVLQWEGQGDILSTNRCPATHPIPWAGGFAEKLANGTSKIQALGSYPVGWNPESWNTEGAGWGVWVRGFNNSPIGSGEHELLTRMVCGSVGHFDVEDDVKQYYESENPGTWAVVECPDDHPIPLTGGGRTTSTGTVLTISKPLGWNSVDDWNGPLGARWEAAADNFDQSVHPVESHIVCRTLREGENLP